MVMDMGGVPFGGCRGHRAGRTLAGYGAYSAVGVGALINRPWRTMHAGASTLTISQLSYANHGLSFIDN